MPSQEYKNIMLTIYLSSFSNNFSLFEEKSIKFINFLILKKGCVYILICLLDMLWIDSFYDLLRHTIYPLLAKTPLHLT